jgi:hypothetical protein
MPCRTVFDQDLQRPQRLCHSSWFLLAYFVFASSYALVARLSIKANVHLGCTRQRRYAFRKQDTVKSTRKLDQLEKIGTMLAWQQALQTQIEPETQFQEGIIIKIK